MTSNWQDKTLLVSGGSSGLGLHIARAAASLGAKVVILGRSEEKLNAAKQSLETIDNARIQTLQADATGDLETSQLHTWINRNPLHVLINAIGRSDRGPSMSLTYQEHVDHYRDNVLAVWNITKSCLPSLKQSAGSIVNIGSLAGLIATPNMGAYCNTKFALTAMTRQWRLEFASDGIHVMLVCPGPIRREDSIDRYNSVMVSRGLADTVLSKPGAGAKLRLLEPERLSHEILNGILKKKSELVFPWKARLLASIAPLFPALADRLLQQNIR